RDPPGSGIPGVAAVRHTGGGGARGRATGRPGAEGRPCRAGAPHPAAGDVRRRSRWCALSRLRRGAPAPAGPAGASGVKHLCVRKCRHFRRRKVRGRYYRCGTAISERGSLLSSDVAGSSKRPRRTCMTERAPAGVDVSTPNIARIYDYMLGGKDNFAVDRAAAERVLKAFPESREGARQHREFLGNVVRFLAGEAGITQFIDIGAGLPTQKNVHEVAQEVNPDARVVYVDNDPVVCVQGRALLASSPNVAMVQADLCEIDDLWTKVLATGLIDEKEPVAVLLFAILHFLEDPSEQVAEIRRRIAPGSYLGISHMVRRPAREGDVATVSEVYAASAPGFNPRTVEEIKAFLGDFELIPQEKFIPLQVVARLSSIGWGGVGRKP